MEKDAFREDGDGDADADERYGLLSLSNAGIWKLCWNFEERGRESGPLSLLSS